MEINIIEDEPKSLIVEFIGADRGIAETIKAKLIESGSVDFAAVTKIHFETGNPKLIVKAEKNPKKLVIDSIERINSDLKELKSQIPKK
ncbi:MAG: hypothetical protein ACP5RT_02615 [Candidatus Micrarchaeia archaeon]